MIQSEGLVGKSLGQYQIVEELGRGCMAIVYKAWQVSLRRHVAIKVMLSHLLNDTELVQRFQQEAIVAANLSHPNIVTIYEVPQQDDCFFIVMEYVEGQSLENLILQRGVVFLGQALPILRQVADALDYAHGRQFVHRDVKSANILLSPEGRAVISDFGIAKALEGSGATAKLTSTGVILGSPSYMSPEQIIGQQIDYRSDLYSLGIVAYEMLSGRAPFGGSTTALLYAQVNTPPPDISQLNPALPRHVEPTLRKMLAKRPDDRFPNARAFVEALATGAGVDVAAGTPPPPGRTAVMAPEMVPPPPPAYSTPPPAYNGGSNSQPVTAPPPYGYAAPVAPVDYSERDSGEKKRWGWLLWAGLAGGLLLFLGGIVALGLLLDLDEVLFGQEEEGGRIAFVSDRDGNQEIYVMKSDGSEPYNLSKSSSGFYYPRWSPDVQQISVHVYPPGVAAGEGSAQLFLVNVDTGKREPVEVEVSNVKFADWSPDGTELVFSGENDGDWDLYVFDLESRGVRSLTQGPEDDHFPVWSPDGGEIAFVRVLEGGEREIFIVNSEGRNITNLTNSPGWDVYPNWSPDGERIIFSSQRTGNEELFLMNTDGTGLEQVTDNRSFNNTEPHFSPDGERVLFVSDRDGDKEIYTMRLDGSDIVQLTRNAFLDYNPHWR